MIWFTSDTHFGHAYVIRAANRPWRTVQEMNDALLENINASVQRGDELYILGDFSVKVSAQVAQEMRRRIRCRNVHLVPGNHDKNWGAAPLSGTFIVERDVLTLKTHGRKLILSHCPLADWPGIANGSIHLHGHIHSQGSAYNDLNRDQGIYRMDVGVDANGYKPVPLDAVLARFDGVECIGSLPWRQWASPSGGGNHTRRTKGPKGPAGKGKPAGTRGKPSRKAAAKGAPGAGGNAKAKGSSGKGAPGGASPRTKGEAPGGAATKGGGTAKRSAPRPKGGRG